MCCTSRDTHANSISLAHTVPAHGKVCNLLRASISSIKLSMDVSRLPFPWNIATGKGTNPRVPRHQRLPQ